MPAELEGKIVNKYQVKGALNNIFGQIQEGVGKLFGNLGQQTKGLNKQISGYTVKAYGDAIEMVRAAVRHS